jgi:putative phosphoesterase
MKVLVFSDSHGAEKSMAKAIEDNRSVDSIIFLGDGERDFEYALAKCGIYPYGEMVKDVYQVRGNCDLYSTVPDAVTASFGDLRMFITHGYAQKVKHGCEKLASDAAEKSCSIALFGHTHERFLKKIGNVTVFNPGSLRSGSYGIIKIKKDNAEFKWKNIK